MCRLFLSSAVVSLFGYPNILADDSNHASLVEHCLSFPEFVDDLLKCIGVLWHFYPLFIFISLTLKWTDFRGSGHS